MSYYVKFRGKTLGPLEENQLQDMVRQGKLGRMSEVSHDGQKWTKAGDEETFFPKTSKTVCPPTPRHFPSVSKAIHRQEINSSDGLTLVPPELDASNTSQPNAISQFTDNHISDKNSNDAIWYYSEDGTTGVGPFSQNDLAQLFRQGKISGKTIVWRDSNDDSNSSDPIAAENMPEFVPIFRCSDDAPTSAISWQNAVLSNKHKMETNTDSSREIPEQNNAILPMILNPLERSAIWVFILVLGAATLFALSVMSQLFGVITLCKFSTLKLTLVSMLMLLAADGGIGYGIWTLWRYTSQLRRTTQQPTEANLSLTMNLLGDFWHICVVLPIGFMLLSLLTGIILFAVGITSSDFRGFIPQNEPEQQLRKLEQQLEQISKPNDFNVPENPSEASNNEILQ
ncbi:MAG: DUF4339 domain-containing protein [Planctomycetaceae bacterium]|jgi:hypothetical protein|nr:DUF4339 domain-containing protein [Planctomycetaceae bacterium]